MNLYNFRHILVQPLHNPPTGRQADTPHNSSSRAWLQGYWSRYA